MANEVNELQLEEIHFTPIPSQTNIYGLAKIERNTDPNKVFVSSLSGKVVSVEYPANSLVPYAREVPFTYIPGDAEIVSIDAFDRSEPSNGLVVGISLILLKNSTRSHQKQFLNIYSALQSTGEFSLDSIAEGCQHLELDFVPFQLTHTEIFVKGRKEVVFLLCGSDQNVHVFCEDNQRFEEHATKNTFPELQNLPSNVLSLEVATLQNMRRLTALGCQNGYIKVAMTDLTEEPSVIAEYSLEHDGPISSVRLFLVSSNQSTDHIQEDASDEGDIGTGVKPPTSTDIHLLTSCAIAPSVVYVDVINQGLTNMVALPDSDAFDCVTCACIADVNWDGNNEIILGTYGQELLVYKCIPVYAYEQCVESLDFQLIWRRSFAYPLFAVTYLDLTNDGLKEMIVASLSGLHILQHNLDEALERRKAKLDVQECVT